MPATHTGGILAVAGLLAAVSCLQAQVPTPLQIAIDSLPAATVGAAYSQQLVTTGGACTANGAPFSSIDSGALPPGFFISSPPATEQWSLQGVPSAAGNFTFTVHLTWVHVRASPFQPVDCQEYATKTLTLVVQGASAPPPPTSTSLTVDRPQITTVYSIPHFSPAPVTVQVAATGGAVVGIAAQSVTDSGVPWLSVVLQRATTPAVLTISYSVNGLAPGTYIGRVTLTSAGTATLTIPVTLVVVTDTSVQLQAVPSSLTFNSVVGGPDAPGQSVKITVAGESALFQAAVSSTPPNGKWLTVSPSGAATPATLTVAVASKDLTAAVYHGVVTLSATGNASVNIPVTFNLQASTQSLKPVISAGGVVNAAGLGSATAPGTWISIFGTALSVNTRAWRDTDFKNGLLPLALDDISVTINGKAAAVAYISPTQINVLAADDSFTGLAPVQVKNALGASDSVLVPQQTAAPAFFQFSGTKYAAGTHADGSYLAGPALAPAGISGTPAKIGETVVLFGTGFGATQPAISATALVPAALPLARLADLGVRIGGLDCAIAFAGLISPGVYQFNVVVPDLPAGDQLVVAELRGLLTQSGLMLTVQR